MNSKTMQTDTLFGHNYSMAMPHFISNQLLGVDCTLSDCNQSFSFSLKSCHRKTGIHFTTTWYDLLLISIAMCELHSLHINVCKINIFSIL